ncbi:MAG: type II restriction enzyme [Clostridium fessum]
MSLIDDKWRILFDKYRIEREIEKHGRFYITADQIREVKEPRLMTKFDTRESPAAGVWKEDFDSSGVARRLCAGRV